MPNCELFPDLNWEGATDRPVTIQQEVLKESLCNEKHCNPLGANEKTRVGSAASGTFDEGKSDVDYMIVPTWIEIQESGLEYRHECPCYLKIPNQSLDEGIQRVLAGKDGFVEASRIRSFYKDMFGSFTWPFQDKGDSNVGEVLLGEVTVGRVRMRGPMDDVPQLKLIGVPMTVRKFIDRKRNWPPRDVILSILSEGFHITARPSPINPEPDHDFCLYFAKAEVKLAQAMDFVQKESIIKLKALNIKNMDKLLTSYQMKTVAYWAFENFVKEYFCESNEFLVAILETLDRVISSGHLPHYFVPTMNLFDEIQLSYHGRRKLQKALSAAINNADSVAIIGHNEKTMTMNRKNKKKMAD